MIDKNYDGILGVLFEHKVTDYQFIIFSCYLPPEDSPWGQDSDMFFGHLLGEIYANNYVDNYFICGDLNGRIGNMRDYTPDVDNLPTRINIDK